MDHGTKFCEMSFLELCIRRLQPVVKTKQKVAYWPTERRDRQLTEGQGQGRQSQSRAGATLDYQTLCSDA